MRLINDIKLDEFEQAMHDLSFNQHQTTNSKVALFCEHDGIFIRFTRARTTWQALATCALKPWWLVLKPLRKNRQNKITTKDRETEVIENA